MSHRKVTKLKSKFSLILGWLNRALNNPALSIRGFHVAQVSLIVTQVKNKIAYHLINLVKKLKYRRGVINKLRAKISGMCDIPNSSYSAKGITEIYSV